MSRKAWGSESWIFVHHGRTGQAVSCSSGAGFTMADTFKLGASGLRAKVKEQSQFRKRRMVRESTLIIVEKSRGKIFRKEIIWMRILY